MKKFIHRIAHYLYLNDSVVYAKSKGNRLYTGIKCVKCGEIDLLDFMSMPENFAKEMEEIINSEGGITSLID